MERRHPNHSLLCVHGERRDYCLEEARDREGDAMLVIDELDAIMYDEEDFVRGGFYYSASGGVHSMERHFTNLTDEVAADGNIALFDHDVSLCHRYDRSLETHHYEVVANWDSMGSSAETGFQVEFTIDLYREGNIQAAITEPDLRTHLLRPGQRLSYATREMTPYDYQQLLRLLMDVSVMRDAELSENRLSDSSYE